MSQSTVYLQSNKLIPGADFRVSRNSENAWSGSMSFSCLYDDWTSGLNYIFTIDTPITDWYTELSGTYSFLRVTEVSVEMQPGGITRINTQFAGVPPAGSTPEPSGESSVSYQLTSVQEEVELDPFQILEISQNEFDYLEASAYQAIIRGTGSILSPDEEDSAGFVKVLSSDGLQNFIGRVQKTSDGELKRTYDLIINQGVRTTTRSVLEWSQTTTDQGGLEAEDYKYLGYLAKDGDPPKTPKSLPEDIKWLLSSISESRTSMRGNTTENSVTWTKTWRQVKGDERYADFLYRDQPPET
jgi:hypothetical protein